MAAANQEKWGGEAALHFEGAARILKTYHNLVCICDNHQACLLWSPYDSKNKETSLIHKVLRELGIPHKLIDVYQTRAGERFASPIRGEPQPRYFADARETFGGLTSPTSPLYFEESHHFAFKDCKGDESLRF